MVIKATVASDDLPQVKLYKQRSYRLINSKYPPVSVFDDVANADEFDVLYELQALTNPRLQAQAGNLSLLPRSNIPFGITGCSYAVAPFTHVNPAGSRFSDGRFGVLYLADSVQTAISEVAYHQGQYWSRVPGLAYERFVFKALSCEFSEVSLTDLTYLPLQHGVYHSKDYSAARALGISLREQHGAGVQYYSVRNNAALCWGLFSPQYVTQMVQSAHYEMIWQSGRINAINKIVSCV
ncbi:RES family NAD+ phosphorylase [Rheinheimera baltica]|uniref:RES family NAD+ phosphorylase n=2 Tax=Rheinheimera baltica TaxID=67576 RepID=UPI00273E5750|nr:RES family NAD+ phosphorylase [Rheinheimera baltica]MDP5143902.1 RES family NAD+ phosphorylase [Rheinheimera baltica]MDP5151670.1 RES family NAD+ phosphorylase [Rheinheimera baltica]